MCQHEKPEDQLRLFVFPIQPTISSASGGATFCTSRTRPPALERVFLIP